jgi:hypothetical protein
MIISLKAVGILYVIISYIYLGSLVGPTCPKTLIRRVFQVPSKVGSGTFRYPLHLGFGV